MKVFRKTAAFGFLLALSASASEFNVGPLNESDTVYFNSSAKLEFIRGTTQHIDGNFIFNPGNPVEGVTGILRVDLRTLETGIDKRDEHMRNNHLHTDKFPYAYFELLSADALPAQMTFDSVYDVKAKGNFYIHGHYREIVAELKVALKKLPTGGDALEVAANFEINLDDYEIPRPKALFLKLAETIEIKAIFSGSSGTPTKAVVLPDWPKLD